MLRLERSSSWTVVFLVGSYEVDMSSQYKIAAGRQRHAGIRKGSDTDAAMTRQDRDDAPLLPLGITHMKLDGRKQGPWQLYR